ncbi:bifunctional riboflavin kinase/FAD synthetase [bacterium]|nr:bifunctional riboflavin kinase/FAD synthetase [bacterium]
MLIQTDLENITYSKNTIITIGTFDGIHRGHQEILKSLVSESALRNWRSVLLTFEPHPQTIIRPERIPQMRILTTIGEKADILDKLGVDVLIVAKFDNELASKTGEEFIKDILLSKIGMAKCVIGHDHVFGKNRSGNFDLMMRLSRSCGFEVNQINAIVHEDTVINSTLIRRLIREGHIEKANQFLNRPYLYSGKIVKGDGRGRAIGYPTANIAGHPLKLVPKNGVYACFVHLKNNKYMAVTNIGSRPTFTNADEAIIETHLLDFSNNVYDDEIQIEFLYRIRDEAKFNSTEELKQQISEDIKTALNKGFPIN